MKILVAYDGKHRDTKEWNQNVFKFILEILDLSILKFIIQI